MKQVAAFLPNAIGCFKALIDYLANMTQLQADKARRLLRVLLGKEIALHPTSDGVERYLTAEVQWRFYGITAARGGSK